jgi:hypothetical protein
MTAYGEIPPSFLHPIMTAPGAKGDGRERIVRFLYGVTREPRGRKIGRLTVIDGDKA